MISSRPNIVALDSSDSTPTITVNPPDTDPDGQHNGGDSPGAGAGGPGGGGSASPTPVKDPVCPVTVNPNDQNATKAAVQTEAGRLARDILNMPDVDSREYRAMIYMGTDGAVHTTAIYAGDSMQSNVPSFAELGFSPSQELGNVHNHPANNNTGSISMAISRDPSPGDWDTFDSDVSAGADRNKLQEFIIGPDHVLRDYDTNNERQNLAGSGVPTVVIPTTSC